MFVIWTNGKVKGDQNAWKTKGASSAMCRMNTIELSISLMAELARAERPACSLGASRGDWLRHGGPERVVGVTWGGKRGGRKR